MNEEQRNKVLNFTLGRISRKDLLAAFPCDLERPGTWIAAALLEALASKDAANVEHIMLLGFKFGFPDDCVEVLCKIMLQDWHNQHENIAMVLKDLRSPGSTDCLYQTVEAHFPYLDYDESYALGVKCLYALHAIGTPQAREKLALLASSSNEVISERAGRLLQSQ